MAVCVYFLQGRCRFGQNCRFEHIYSTDDRGNRNSQQLNNVVRQIVGEVILTEKSGQWPLSCFSPLKEGPNIPGWEDVSPEEVRWKMYQARANGTLNQCINEINQLYSEAEKRRNMLKQPTVETINMIVNVLKGNKDLSTAQNPFTSGASSTSSNIFGGSSQSTGTQNIFGNSTQSTGNIFGGSPQSSPPKGNIFGGSALSQGNIFGGSSTNFSNQNLFGGSTSQNSFSQNVFTNQPASNQNIFSSGSGNIFSNQPVQNVFSNTQLTGRTTTNQNVFSSPGTPGGIFTSQTPNTGNIFAAQSAFFPNADNKTTNQSNVFGTPQNENIFKSQNVFGGQPETNKNIFGGESKQSFGNQQRPKASDSSVYSKVEDLTEEDIKSFTAATFSFGKIPLKPPPQEYCK